MKRFSLLTVTALSVGGLALVSSAEEAKAPSLKELMGKTHKGEKSALVRVDRQLKTDQPVWAEVQVDTKLLVEVGQVLAKSKEVKPYTSAEAYVSSVQALNDAAQKKDKLAAAAAFKDLRNSCTNCHYYGSVN